MPTSEMALTDPLLLGVVVLAALLVGLLSVLAARGILTPPLRRIPAYDRLPDQVGRSLETRQRVHLSPGPGSIHQRDATATVAALALLRYASEPATLSDLQPVATTSDATTLPVTGDALYRAYRERGAARRYRVTNARLLAFDAFTLVGGVTSIVHEQEVGTNLLFGAFGAEAALALEAGSRRRAVQFLASDQVEGIAVGFASADDVLIGQEMFAAQAYLGEQPTGVGSAAAQDVLRWVVIAAVLVGALFASFGLIR